MRHAQVNPNSECTGFGDLCWLLTDMQQHTPDGRYIGVATCSQLLQPVAAIYHRQVMPSEFDLLPIGQPGAASRLYASSKYNPDGTIDLMANRLWELVGMHIEARNYSVVNQRYAPFTAADISDIERCRRVA